MASLWSNDNLPRCGRLQLPIQWCILALLITTAGVNGGNGQEAFLPSFSTIEYGLFNVKVLGSTAKHTICSMVIMNRGRENDDAVSRHNFSTLVLLLFLIVF